MCNSMVGVCSTMTTISVYKGVVTMPSLWNSPGVLYEQHFSPSLAQCGGRPGKDPALTIVFMYSTNESLSTRDFPGRPLHTRQLAKSHVMADHDIFGGLVQDLVLTTTMRECMWTIR